MTTDNNPVTVVISRRVKKGKEKAFEALSARMTEAASHFPGYLGAVLFPPYSPDDPEYRVAFKFDTQAHLDAWMASEEREKWLREIEDLLVEPSSVEVLSGLTPWFSLPGQNPVHPPPKYKMAVISWLALFPTVTLIFGALGDDLQVLPLVPRVALVTAVVIYLMTYVIMPRFTRWFAFWLFPKKQRETR